MAIWNVLSIATWHNWHSCIFERRNRTRQCPESRAVLAVDGITHLCQNSFSREVARSSKQKDNKRETVRSKTILRIASSKAEPGGLSIILQCIMQFEGGCAKMQKRAALRRTRELSQCDTEVEINSKMSQAVKPQDASSDRWNVTATIPSVGVKKSA
jgi:hypothetical protein